MKRNRPQRQLQLEFKVNEAISEAHKILDANQRPIYAPNATGKQSYDDKFLLAEIAVRMGVRMTSDLVAEAVGQDSWQAAVAAFGAAARAGKRVTLLAVSSESVELADTRVSSIETMGILKDKTITQEVTVNNAGDQHNTSSTTTTTKEETKFVTKIVDHHWNISYKWTITAYIGGCRPYRTGTFQGREMLLADGIVEQRLVTRGSIAAKDNPVPPRARQGIRFECDATFLFSHSAADGGFRDGARGVVGEERAEGAGGADDGQALIFEIDRSKRSCRTPRRNDDVERALEGFAQVRKFVMAIVEDIKLVHVFRLSQATELSSSITQRPQTRKQAVGSTLQFNDDRAHLMSLLEAVRVVHPIYASFSFICNNDNEDGDNNDDDNDSSSAAPIQSAGGEAAIVMPWASLDAIATEYARRIARIANNSCSHTGDASGGSNDNNNNTNDNGSNDNNDSLARAPSGKLALMRLTTFLQAVDETIEAVGNVVDEVERMIETQLVQAIGRVLTCADIDELMEHHNRCIFRRDFAPVGFCHAVGMPECTPVGQVRLEAHGVSGPRPVACFTRALSSSPQSPSMPPLEIALDAATSVKLGGERHVHAFVMNTFGGVGPPDLTLTARARQFSSFILMAGKVIGPHAFEPVAALVVKDKDEVVFDVLANPIPTPKEFHDAIESLSPEQQEFARAFRELQLSSTLFGVCIVQIKPQLERVLHLPPGTLTKEIVLTQQLLDLCMEYQVPTDLLSFDGPGETDAAVRIAAVKSHVERVKVALNLAKEDEIAAQRQRATNAALVAAEREPGRKYISKPEQSFVETRSVGRSSRPCRAQRVALGCVVRPNRDNDLPSLPSPKLRSAAVLSAHVGSVGRVHTTDEKSRYLSSPDYSSQSLEATTKFESLVTTAVTEWPATDAGEGNESDGAGSSDQAPVRPLTREDEVEAGEEGRATGGAREPVDDLDVTMLPVMLNERLKKVGAPLRPTTLKVGPTWKRTTRDGLLGKPSTKNHGEEDMRAMKDKAFDLLDALTRSGGLPVDAASFHVVLAATHCFTHTVMDMLVHQNVNPVKHLEASSLLAARVVWSGVQDENALTN